MAIALWSFAANTGLSVTSSAFAANGMIPAQYTCEGDEVSPPLKLANIPPGAKSLALIVHDPDAPMKGGVTHWVVWNMGVQEDIPEGFKNAEQGMNSSNTLGYKGMCPPMGVHHYHFMVYALDTRLGLEGNTDKAGLESAMKGHILAQGDLVGLYKKMK